MNGFAAGLGGRMLIDDDPVDPVERRPLLLDIELLSEKRLALPYPGTRLDAGGTGLRVTRPGGAPRVNPEGGVSAMASAERVANAEPTTCALTGTPAGSAKGSAVCVVVRETMILGTETVLFIPFSAILCDTARKEASIALRETCMMERLRSTVARRRLRMQRTRSAPRMRSAMIPPKRPPTIAPVLALCASEESREGDEPVLPPEVGDVFEAEAVPLDPVLRAENTSEVLLWLESPWFPTAGTDTWDTSFPPPFPPTFPASVATAKGAEVIVAVAASVAEASVAAEALFAADAALATDADAASVAAAADEEEEETASEEADAPLLFTTAAPAPLLLMSAAPTAPETAI